ncbi:MAG: ABC-type transport auxiliary lipoprotein family protein [Rhizobiaceae bacterium]|nr:ABC-type transport auxiliary lipoprotein family protein [Rhizobiaceae bacterium]
MGFGRTIAGLTIAGVLLAGCAAVPGLGPGALDTYQLTITPPPAKGRRLSRTQVLVAEPSAIKALDSQSIVIKPGPGMIEYLSGAQWADRLPKVVQASLVEGFQLSGRLGGVGKPGEGLAIDYQVITEIRSFEIRVDGAARAEIDLNVRILNDRNGVVRATRSFSASIPVAGKGNDAFIEALNAGFDQVAGEIVTWSLRAM